MPGLFGSMFDFNHDGKLDPLEETAEFMFIEEVLMESDDSDDDDDDADDD